MGAYCSRQKPFRILFQGLDAAGKTSLLYWLKLGEVVTTIPTIGFNVEEIDSYGFHISCWDIGGRDKIRPLYRHYYPNTDGFVYVIDSADEERLDQALDELDRYLLNEDATRQSVIMILANKQDLKGAMPLEKMEEIIKEKIKHHGPTLGDRSLFLKGCSVTDGVGVEEAFSTFVHLIQQKSAGLFTPGWKSLQHMQEQNDASNKESAKAKIDGEGQLKFLFKKFLDVTYLKSFLYY